MKIAPGLFFDTGSMMTDGFCGSVNRCLSIKGSRVYCHREFADPERTAEEAQETPSFCSIKTVNYVRATFAELEAIRNLSVQCRAAIHAASAALTLDFLNKALLKDTSTRRESDSPKNEVIKTFMLPFGLELVTKGSGGAIQASKLKDEICEPAADAIESLLLAMACEGLLQDDARLSNALVTAVEAVAGHVGWVRSLKVRL